MRAKKSSLQEAPAPADDPARRRIVIEARRHFMAHGFRGVTMDDLAAELGMSKKTLYAHFSGKTALLQAVLDDKLKSADADFGEITQRISADFLGALHDLLACVRRHSEELQPAFMRDMAREAPELFQLVQARRRTLIQCHFGKLLGEGRKAGMIRKDIPADLMIEILVGATDALVNPQKLSQLNLPAKTGLTAIVTIFLEGVLTGKGRSKS
jgi:TetR/AcrR family transcriptional regulator, cholesterol catabolism regulator